jgi:nucleotide-binding universal stress UspA family protein
MTRFLGAHVGSCHGLAIASAADGRGTRSAYGRGMTSRPKIVVGIDGSRSGDDALAFARALAEALGAGLILTHAYGRGEDRAGARAILEARRAELGDIEVELAPFADLSAARALHCVAAARRAGLVVVGPSHRAGLGRIVPGSTGQQLVHDTPRAVAVVPRGWQPRPEHPLTHIGCAYDGSPEAGAALATAVTLTRELGGHLDVMRAFWSAPLSGVSGIAAAADLEARGHAGLGTVVQDLPADVDARARLMLNDPARAIVARSRGIDLLVLGSRAYGPLRSVWAGSVARQVLNDAACPVIVVPRGVHPPLVGPPRPQVAQPERSQAS